MASEVVHAYRCVKAKYEQNWDGSERGGVKNWRWGGNVVTLLLYVN